MDNTNENLSDLSPDDILLGSLSYKGCSSRFEMWILLIVFFAASVPLAFLGLLGGLLVAAFNILCVWPLLVRRARQMGAAPYGVLLIVAGVILASVEATLGYLHGHEPGYLPESFATLNGIFLLMHLPLFIYGGPLSGRKTPLMRAAIASDADEVRRLAEQFPQTLLLKSERGYSARDYAERLGYANIATYLKQQEAALNEHCS